MSNIDQATVDGFGAEWTTFDQTGLPPEELDRLFEQYFRIFPWNDLPQDPVGFDLGCGSGRWAARVAPRVGRLDCIDASPAALAVARRNLADYENCVLHHASVDDLPLEDGSMDFGYALGVLHHIPDTQAGIASCVEKLRPGAPLLLYLYYAFDDRPRWFRALWRLSDVVRRAVSKFPSRVKTWCAAFMAVGVYWPLARLAKLVERSGRNVDGLPLSFYRNSSVYTMRTDALDRFGTRLEQRFSAPEVVRMMASAGLEEIRVSDDAPYWCAVGRRAA
jgi:SAM-dependent methyltransferase